VPRLTKHNKHALAYEQEFLTIALKLWGKLPNTVTDIFPVSMNDSQHMYLLITYDNTQESLEMPLAVTQLTVEQFLRPKKKVRGRKQDMKTV